MRSDDCEANESESVRRCALETRRRTYSEGVDRRDVDREVDEALDQQRERLKHYFVADNGLGADLGEELASQVDVVGLFIDSGFCEGGDEDAAVLNWKCLDRSDSFGDALD
jgi:hypothetical protein